VGAARPASGRPDDRLVLIPPRRRQFNARARAWEYPQFSDELGPDAGRRSALHLRLSDRGGLVFGLLDLIVMPSFRFFTAMSACVTPVFRLRLDERLISVQV